MANSKKSRSVAPAESATLDRVAARVRDDADAADRLVAFVDRGAEAEALATYIVLQLKEAISSSGSSAYAIAKRSNVSESSISKFIRGEKPNLTLDTLAKLCVDLGLAIMLVPKPDAPRARK